MTNQAADQPRWVTMWRRDQSAPVIERRKVTAAQAVQWQNLLASGVGVFEIRSSDGVRLVPVWAVTELLVASQGPTFATVL